MTSCTWPSVGHSLCPRLSAGVLDQMGRMPEEWGGGSGFSKRVVADGHGIRVGRDRHSVAAVIHHRVLYDACTCRGFARVKHAMGRAFVSCTRTAIGPNYSSGWRAARRGWPVTWYPRANTVDMFREGSLGTISGGLKYPQRILAGADEAHTVSMRPVFSVVAPCRRAPRPSRSTPDFHHGLLGFVKGDRCRVTIRYETPFLSGLVIVPRYLRRRLGDGCWASGRWWTRHRRPIWSGSSPSR